MGMNSDKPDVSICIVNHNTPDLTRNCIASIYATCQKCNYEILLLNNTTAECEIDARNFSFYFIQNSEPHSFAYNQNRLIEAANGRYIMSLNSDTILHPGALTMLTQFLDIHSLCGVVGPRLVYADGTLQPSCLNFPNAFTTFMEASGRWVHFKKNRFIARFHYLCDPHDKDRQTDWLYGACLLFRREALEAVGGFDEHTFSQMYGEDVDLMWRMAKKGWQIWFAAAPTVTHLENQSPMKDRPFRIQAGARLFHRKNYSQAQQWLIRLAIVFALIPKRILIRDPVRRKEFSRIITGHLLNRLWNNDAAWI